jgi:hypothetical protein
MIDIYYLKEAVQNGHAMKCFTIWQPYAELVAIGKKTIEIRKMKISFRGKFLIYAASLRSIDLTICNKIKLDFSKLATSKVIGLACLYDIKKYSSKEEFEADKERHCVPYYYPEAKYGFLLKDAGKFNKPVHILRVRPGIFDVHPEDIVWN